MRCTWVQERILLYLAGELSSQETARLLRHMERCEACTALVEQLAETQARVESSLHTDMEAPPALQARIMEAVRSLPPARRTWHVTLPDRGWRRRLEIAAAALCLLVVGFSGGSWYGYRSATATPAEARTLDLAQLGAIVPNSPVDLPPVEPSEMSQALTQRLRFPVLVVDLQPEGAQLMGASTTTVQGTPVAGLRYRFGGGIVLLFQMDAAKLSPPTLREAIFRSENYLAGKMKGFSYVAWRSGNTNCVMIAHTVPMHNLFRLACHACEKQDRL